MAKIHLPLELKKFGDIFDTLSRSHGTYYIFQDFLDFSINAWSLNHQADIDTIRKKYDRRELDLFNGLIIEAIRILDKMIVTDTDVYDVYGTFYEANSLTNKHFAQFFTPMTICQFMAQILSPTGPENFNDPCSGSGRLSLAANSVNPGMFHTLIDIDYTCARMSALNLMYHGIHGIVISDNALWAGKDFRGAFIVNRWLKYSGVPQIEFVADINRAYGYARKKLGMPEPSPQKGKVPENRNTNAQEVADVIVDSKTNQIRLF